jgi:hypothetical protein
VYFFALVFLAVVTLTIPETALYLLGLRRSDRPPADITRKII